MKKIVSALLALCLMSMVFLAGCNSSGNSSKMEEYLDASAEALAEAIETLKDTMELTVTGEGSTLVYTYKFNDEVDAEEIRAALEEQEENVKQTTESVLMTEMEAFGIDNPKVKYIYLNNDGTEIYSVLFE